ncbi:hypothetical protein cand_012720 [Cryptosporidium andersoni]|uniref:Uncharacterized protein n=1 Tax=Cryptosporidium andersoni TaxID=117008 RepID=A0A1J4MDK1_9CRYT|nr:hypothetical protein cand_012720 [Cryptosporidium andersoni]
MALSAGSRNSDSSASIGNYNITRNKLGLQMIRRNWLRWILICISMIWCIGKLEASRIERNRYSKQKIPKKLPSTKFRGQLYSDGSILWKKCYRSRNGNWGNWVTASVNEVPRSLINKMLLYQSKSRQSDLSSDSSEFSGEDEMSTSDNSYEGVPVSTSRLEVYPVDETVITPQYRKPTGKFGKEYVESLAEDLVLVQELPRSEIQRSNIPGLESTGKKFLFSTPPLVNPYETSRPKFIQHSRSSRLQYPNYKVKLSSSLDPLDSQSLKIPATRLKLRKPTIPTKTRNNLSELNKYELSRIQWALFASLYNPSTDNLKLTRKVPPLGFKPVSNVSECTTAYMKAFMTNYCTVSDYIYKKGINKSILVAIEKEIKLWCGSMIKLWYSYLQQVGIQNLPSPSKYMK